MSAPQFTPGPWQRSGVRNKLGEHDCLAVGPDGFSIAFLPIGARPGEQAGAIADARLIAAAPELYEALETLTIFAAETIRRLKLKDTNGIVAAADSALAKARGEQQ